MESAEARHRFRPAQELLDQEVPSSHHTTTAPGQLEEKIESQVIIQEEGLLPKVLDQHYEVKSVKRLQVPRRLFERARSV